MTRVALGGSVLLARVSLSILLSGWITQLSAQAPASLAGHVMDAVSDAPVVGAKVVLGEGLARVSTDQEGRFRMSMIAEGTYAVHVVRMGYEDLTVDGVRVGSTDLDLTLQLFPAAVSLSEIVVSPGSYSFIGRSPSPRQTMSRVDIESVLQFAEDIFRAVNRLPGLSSGDYSAHFSVRGGRHDETLILLDGLEVYEPYHLKDFNDGAVSIIDVETIEGVELMTGGFPVRHGNRTSGVFSVTSRDPGEEDPRYSVGLSLVNARLMGQGSFADGKGLWFISGRRGYLNLVLKLTNATGLPAPAYHDVFGKLTY